MPQPPLSHVWLWTGRVARPALVGSFGTQMWNERRAERRAHRKRQAELMLQVHGELTELFATVLEFAKRKRLAGQPPGGSIEIMTRETHLRPLVEIA